MSFRFISEANTAAQDADEGAEWKGGGQERTSIRSPLSGHLAMENTGKVKFDPPMVPVIFVLGAYLFFRKEPHVD